MYLEIVTKKRLLSRFSSSMVRDCRLLSICEMDVR